MIRYNLTNLIEETIEVGKIPNYQEGYIRNKAIEVYTRTEYLNEKPCQRHERMINEILIQYYKR